MHQTTSHFAKSLRQNLTKADQIVWRYLRNRQLADKFRRQQPLGPYIGDFVCFGKKLIIEIDGSQHSPETDATRTEYLEKKGYRVIRFWNNEVIDNTEGVFQAIEAVLGNTPHPNLLPQGEKESVCTEI
jgi:very-short-patch-repair endonuclease